MSPLVLWLGQQCVGLPTVGRQRASNAGRRPAVDNPSVQPEKFRTDPIGWLAACPPREHSVPLSVILITAGR